MHLTAVWKNEETGNNKDGKKEKDALYSA